MDSLQLHIGGKEIHPEWKILDAIEADHVDYICNAGNLKIFEDSSVSRIYASHVLEHFHYGLNNEVLNTLQEWKRVLVPGGQLLLSVPDLKTLCWLYLHPNLMPIERHHIMRMIFGGQIDHYDVHKSGFDIETISLYLEEVGFRKIESISEFNLFNDSSNMRVLDTLISLNLVITK